jgi:WhiB family redox-sensing transcriptional regulator
MSDDLPSINGLLAQPEPWMVDGRCRVEDIPPDVFFPSRGESLALPKSICARCPVKVQCLDYALRTRQYHGVWGGASERERRRMRSAIAAERTTVDDTAARIRHMRAWGLTDQEIARELGISTRAIYRRLEGDQAS